MLIIEALEKVVERISFLLKERELRRASFFREIVEPIHSTFRQFREEHLATFHEIRTRLKEQIAPLHDLPGIFTDKHSRERGSWILFERLEGLAVSSRVDLGGHYTAYLRTLQECLDRTEGGDNETVSVIFYQGIRSEVTDVVRAVERARISGDLDAASRTREAGLQKVESIVVRFHEYCARVEVCYLQLRQYCLV